MSNQEKGHGHGVTTMHAVRHVFERLPAEKLLGQTPQEFFQKLDMAQAKVDGMPLPNFILTNLFYHAIGGLNERIVAGDGQTALPSDWAPEAQKAHALSDPRLSPSENLAAIKEYLVQELVAARVAHQRGDVDAEFDHLGRVAHCIEDSFSNAHMFRDPSRPDDPEAPIKAILNFDWLHSSKQTHEKSFDEVPTVASNDDLARSTEQACAEALGRVLSVYVQHADTPEGAAAEIAFDRIIEPFFQADDLVTLSDPKDPAYQQMRAEHYANEVSESPVVPDAPEPNMSAVDSSTARPETSSMDPRSATGEEAVSMPPESNSTSEHSQSPPSQSAPEPDVSVVDPSVARPETSSMDPGSASGDDAISMPPPDDSRAAPLSSQPPASFPPDDNTSAPDSTNQAPGESTASSPEHAIVPASSADVATAPASSMHLTAEHTMSAGVADTPANGRFFTADEFRDIAQNQTLEYHPELLSSHPQTNGPTEPGASDNSPDGNGGAIDPSTSHASDQSSSGSIDDNVSIDPSTVPNHGHDACDPQLASVIDPSTHHSADHSGPASTEDNFSIDPSSGAGHPDGHASAGNAHSSTIVDPSGGHHGEAAQSAAVADPSQHHENAVCVDPSAAAAGHQSHHDASSAPAVDPSAHAAAPAQDSGAQHAAAAPPAQHDAAAAHHDAAAAGHH